MPTTPQLRDTATIGTGLQLNELHACAACWDAVYMLAMPTPGVLGMWMQA